MIQRVQTIYLLIASGLLFSLFFNNMATGEEVVLKYTGYLPFLVFTILTFLLSFGAIFLYKNRVLQMRLSIYNMLVLVAYQGWLAYKFFAEGEGLLFSTTTVFPIIAAVFVFLAFRGIKRDEELVQSANSLRTLSKNYKKR